MACFPKLLSHGENYVITKPIGKREPLEINLRLLEQLFDCLAQLESARIVHRDITSRHFLYHNRNLLLIDYGYSVVAESVVQFAGKEFKTK